jgi:hypothetical protein
VILWVAFLVATCAAGFCYSEANPGIDILGTRYSARLRALYERVQRVNKKPMRVVELHAHEDNKMENRPNEIIVYIHRGASEDDVAHELVHALMEHEGYPRSFAISTIPLSRAIHIVVLSDFDHIAINQRLLSLGYDAKNGFLRRSDWPPGVLAMKPPSDREGQAVFRIGMLHELFKFVYYVGRPEAEFLLLSKDPPVQPYWNELRGVLRRLPASPSPDDVWNVTQTYAKLCDRIAADIGAKVRFTELIGFSPAVLQPSELLRRANTVFQVSAQPSTDGELVRFYLVKSGLLVGAQIVQGGAPFRPNWDTDAAEFAHQNHIVFRTVKHAH